jgi:hypothetical protein
MNAAKVAMLLLDYNMSLLPKELRGRLAKDGSKCEEYSASSYNGNPKRPRNILQSGRDLVFANDNFENRMYIMILRALSRHLKKTTELEASQF